MVFKRERNIAALIHVSTFSKYFVPFGNLVLPLLLWTGNRKESAYVEHHGKEALNFQLSLLLYAVLAGLVSIPLIVGALPNVFENGIPEIGALHRLNKLDIGFRDSGHGWGRLLVPVGFTGLVQLVLFAINLVYTILAVVRSSEGEWYRYPVTIRFIK